MKTLSSKYTHALGRLAFISLAVLFAAAVDTRAQRTVPQRDVSSAERNVRSMEIDSSPKRDSKTIMSEVNEDFEWLRTIKDEIKNTSSSSGPFNYKTISDYGVQIKKRSQRLKSNLAGLPKVEDKDKVQKHTIPLDDTQLQSSLSSLHAIITSFVSNPVFSDMGTLDNQLALKASRDLESLIELSDVIKKGAEKLAKHSGQ